MRSCARNNADISASERAKMASYLKIIGDELARDDVSQHFIQLSENILVSYLLSASYGQIA